MSKFDLKNLTSIDNIFEFFKNSNYVVEEDRNPFPVSDLIKKSVEGKRG